MVSPSLERFLQGLQKVLRYGGACNIFRPHLLDQVGLMLDPHLSLDDVAVRLNEMSFFHCEIDHSDATLPEVDREDHIEPHSWPKRTADGYRV